MKYDVIDNFLDPEDHRKIYSAIYGNGNFPWFIFDDKAFGEKEDTGYYFSHLLYFDSQVRSTYFDLIVPILNKLNPKHVIGAKANLYPKTDRLIHNPTHIDYDYEHAGAVYSINTNNGHTNLGNGIQIESVENRLLIFDGSKPHNATNCTDKIARVNINFNLMF